VNKCFDLNYSIKEKHSPATASMVRKDDNLKEDKEDTGLNLPFPKGNTNRRERRHLT
jgi:hypothetical protein